jgi:hypothetical protein
MSVIQFTKDFGVPTAMGRYRKVKYAAEVLGVTPATVRKWFHEGRLCGSQLGGIYGRIMIHCIGFGPRYPKNKGE